MCRIRGHAWGAWRFVRTFASRPHNRVLENRRCKRCGHEQTRAYDLVLEPDLY